MVCQYYEQSYCFICLADYPCCNGCPTYNGHEIDNNGYYASGFHKDTGMDSQGYDRQGYDAFGMNRAGESYVTMPPRDEIDFNLPPQDGWDAEGTEWGEPPAVNQHDLNQPQNEWQQNWMQGANQIDWDALSEGAQADHEAAQMELNMAQGLFIGDVNGDIQAQQDDEETGEEEEHPEDDLDATVVEAIEATGTNESSGGNELGTTAVNDSDDDDLELQTQLMDAMMIRARVPPETGDQEPAHTASTDSLADHVGNQHEPAGESNW